MYGSHSNRDLYMKMEHGIMFPMMRELAEELVRSM